MEKIIFVILFFIVSSSTGYVFINVISKKRKMAQRIKAFIPNSAVRAEDEETEKKKKIFKPLLTFFSKAFNGVNFSHQTAIKLEKAGSSLKLEEFFVIRLLSTFGFGIFLFLVDLPWYLWIPATIAGAILPDLYLIRKGNKRLKLLSYQLAEALGTMSNSLRAGFSFMQTMQLIGKEMPDPIGPEFERTVHEISIGIPMEEAFQNLLSRLPNKELEVVVQAILAQRKTGGNLAQLLDTMEETVRGRLKVLDELKTLTAQGKMSSWILTGLPFVLALYLNFMNPNYFQLMFREPLGITLLVVGSISLLVGWVFIQKIVRIEV